MRRVLPLLLLLAGALPAAEAAPALGKYRFVPEGTVRHVRVVDLDGDGRRDLVILVEDPETGIDELVFARTPATATRKTFFPADHVTRIRCTGDYATSGAVAVGRFGPKGEGRVRFLGPKGILQVRHDGTRESFGKRDAATLFARSTGEDLIFWDGVADLDGDGHDEMWVPLARENGPMQLVGRTPKDDRTLSISANNIGAATDELLLARHAYVPNLFPANVAGDAVKELVALDGTSLVAWELRRSPLAPRSGMHDHAPPIFALELPFLAPDPKRAPTAMFVPRLQVEDVDGDGTADLIVTLLTGEHGKIESLRTTLFHYPGPFVDPKTDTLVRPKARIDTKSCVLHPTFVDVDQDGALDYVGDAMHGTQTELFARMLGKEPTMVYVGFRYDKQAGTFETAPYFKSERPYASSETLSNRFGLSAYFQADFDGDGHGDLLDLGNLKGVEILKGTPAKGGTLTYEPGLMPRIPVKEGLVADAQLADLDGNGRTDAVLWSREAIFLIVPEGAR